VAEFLGSLAIVVVLALFAAVTGNWSMPYALGRSLRRRILF
jgi:hypothetical protein